MIYYLIENDLDQMMNPKDTGTENMEDDEARVFQVRCLFLIQEITRLLLLFTIQKILYIEMSWNHEICLCYSFL